MTITLEKQKYYYYANIHTPNWYTLTIEVMRESIANSKDELGKRKNYFSAMFIFMGFYIEAHTKEEAEAAYKNGDELMFCKEPACMLRDRREDYLERRKHIIL